MVDKFIELFTGYQGDFGIADMSSAQLDTDKNKLKPNYEWAGRPITQGDYRDHIAGKISIGIQPCRLDKTVQFGCIDIDSKDYASFKVENYLALFQQFKLPLVPLLSKSGGLHCAGFSFRMQIDNNLWEDRNRFFSFIDERFINIQIQY